MNLMTVFFLQAPAAGPDGSMMWIMLIAMFAIMYFFMIRPQNKKQKEIANDVVLEIASNVKIHIDKNSIFAAAADANSSQASK